MKADIDLIKKIASGAVSVFEKDGFFEFHRMTAEQENVLVGKADFYKKSLASSGIRLEFLTDAARVSIAGYLEPIFGRHIAFFDIAVNGISVKNIGSTDFSNDPEFNITVDLDGGKINRAVIYLPMLAITKISALEFTGATTVEPVSKSFTMLCYGDSITQGATAYHPSLAYVNLLADTLNARLYNKAVCGGIFDPEFAGCPDTFSPQLITVAYGTNDWRKTTFEELTDNARKFFDNLNKNYPGTPIIALSPIWRKNMEGIQKAGTFQDVLTLLNEIYAEYDNITAIDGMFLTPHLTDFYEDGTLHPNDAGFLYFTQKLLQNPAFEKFRTGA